VTKTRRAITFLAGLLIAIAMAGALAPSAFASRPRTNGDAVVTPSPVPAHPAIVVAGGMPGWQIALIAVGSALIAAGAAVLIARARFRRQPAASTAG
jgi:ABC-type Fe3+-hydroxamate transport system substrate-binding protein